MENTETTIQKEESTTVIPEVTEETPTETVPIVNGETTSVTETVEKKEEKEETSTTMKSTDEQENVTDTNTTVPPASLSPGRANIPLKEVNESEKEEPTVVLPNGTENGISKKRELEQEDEVTEETTTDNDERNGLDQSKKIKISETIDTPIMETKEPEKNIIVNGNTAVEV